MADYKKLSTTQMRQQANKITQLRERYDQVISDLSSLVGVLEEVWDTPETQSFKSAFEGIKKTFMDFAPKITDMSEVLTSAADKEDATSAENKATIESRLG